jgi:hypothetical protein
MNKIKVFFKKHFLVRDTIAVLLPLVAVGVVLKRLNKEELTGLLLENSATIFPLFFNAGITLVGCILTGLCVLTAFLDKSQLERLKITSLFQEIFGIFFNALLFCGIFSITSIWGLIKPEIFVCHLVSIIILLLIARIWRCVWIFRQLVAIVCKP